MAQYTKSISIAFNDNDGGVTWIANPETSGDISNYYKKHGKWKARIIFLRMFWMGLRWLEKNQHE